eukprot:403337158
MSSQSLSQSARSQLSTKTRTPHTKRASVIIEHQKTKRLTKLNVNQNIQYMIPPIQDNNELSASKFDFADDLTKDLSHLTKKHKVPNFLVQTKIKANETKNSSQGNVGKQTSQKEVTKFEKKTLKRGTKLNFDSDESDFELPKNEQHVIMKVQDSDYLKLYQMKNPMHDADGECSKSIMCNLVMPDPETFRNNPYLNKTPIKEPQLNLHTMDLLSMAQITPHDERKYKNQSEMDMQTDRKQEFINKQKDEEKKLLNYVKDQMLKGKLYENQKVVKQGFQSELDRKLRERIIMHDVAKNQHESSLPNIGDRDYKYKISNLTKEIQLLPYHKLRRKFMQKNKEVEQFIEGGNLGKFDSNTLVSEKDKERFMKNQPDFLDQIKTKKYEDPLIKINHILPKNFLNSIKDKYDINPQEITPQLKKAKEVQGFDDEILLPKNLRNAFFNIGDYINESKQSFLKLYNKTPEPQRQGKHKKFNSIQLIPLLKINNQQLSNKFHSRNTSIQTNPYANYTFSAQINESPVFNNQQGNDHESLYNADSSAKSALTLRKTSIIEQSMQMFQDNQKQSLRIRNNSNRQYKQLQKFKAKILRCDKLLQKQDKYVEKLDDLKLDKPQRQETSQFNTIQAKSNIDLLGASDHSLLNKYENSTLHKIPQNLSQNDLLLQATQNSKEYQEQQEIDRILEINNFPYYEKQFIKKQKAWTKNEIKKIDTNYQKLLHIALTQKKVQNGI